MAQGNEHYHQAALTSSEGMINRKHTEGAATPATLERKMRVLINSCWGGFNISEAGALRLRELGMAVEIDYDEWVYDKVTHREAYVHLPNDVKRHDARLLQCFDELGQAMAGSSCELKAVEVTGDRYRVCDYDGREWVETPDSIEWVLVS